MANAVLYNQGSHPAGALKSGTMSMNVSPSLDIGALKWRNGYENNNMWVIYSDTYSQGQSTQGNALPTIWATPTFTDAGLVNLINTLPARAGQTPFTDVTAATSWLRGQGVYFLSNQNYPQIVTSGMTLLMDAGFSASFPTGTGTTTYDLSGSDNNGTLTNGPIWVNSGTTSYFDFDGSDDFITFGNNSSLNPQSVTMRLVVNFDTFSTRPHIGKGGGSVGAYYIVIETSSSYMFYYTKTNSSWASLNAGSLSTGLWYDLVVTYDSTGAKAYKNGILVASNSDGGSLSTTDGDNLKIGGYGGNPGLPVDGKVSIFQIYNRALSQSEILQNYYKGPIVTSGLTLALDAGNLVSYGGTGTSWKDLTSNAFNGTLTNGPTYSSDSDGCIVFDGADDMVRITNASPLGTSYNWTTEAWIKWSNNGYTSWMTIIDSGNYGSAANYMMWISPDTSQKLLATYTNTDGWDYGTIPLNPNTWYHITLTKRAGTSGIKNSPVRFFVNGVFDVERNYTYTDSVATNDLGVGLTPSNQNYPMNGKIAQAKVYNRALSDAEVAQNFNAQRGRFGI